MTTVLIILFVVVLLIVGVSLALGRSTYEVDSARDTEYLELEGTWVRYNVIGGGPPVVLVHGWLSSSVVWENLAGRLAQRFTVYTLDLTGFGESDKPLSGYGVRYGSRLIYAFCAHFGLTRASIIGHDLGGNMAVKLAADHPDVVGRIVLVATPANEEQIDLPTPLWAATLPVVGPIFYMLGRAVRPVRAMWMKPFVSEAEDLTEDIIEDAANSTPAAMRETLKVSQREISGGRLARQARIIKVPVLVVAGEEDQIVDPQAAGVWARSLDQADVCLMEECGHMPMIERIGEFNAQILAFLTGDARYLEYIERASDEDDEESAIEDESDDTESFDTREVPTDTRDRTEPRRDDEPPIIIPDERDDSPAFGPPPGETDGQRIEDQPERAFREDEFHEDEARENEFREEEVRGWSRPEDTRERRIREKMMREEEEAARRNDAFDSRGAGSEDDVDETDDTPPPVVRRLGDRLSGRRRRLGAEPEESDDVSPDTHDPLEDETSELDAPGGKAFEEQIEETPPAPGPRRRRPRRETLDSDSEPGDGDVVPEVPSDLFDWGSTWDEDIKRPRERPPRRSRRRSEETDGEPNGSSDGNPDSEGNSNGSPDEPRL